MKSSGKFCGGAEVVSDRGSLSDRFQVDEVYEPMSPSPGRVRRTKIGPDGRVSRGAKDLMSKAFVEESDSEADLPYEPPAIPAGIKNYMAPEGHRQMQDELHQRCESSASKWWKQ